MSELAARLRRLRAQAGAAATIAPEGRSREMAAAAVRTAAPRAEEGAAAVSAEGLKALLRRHRAVAMPTADRGGESAGQAGEREAAAPPATGAAAAEANLPLEGGCAHAESVERLGDAAPMPADCGTELSPGLFEHRELLPIAPPAPWLWLPDLHARLLPTDALLHFDTETTGLAGGTGTRAFMLGFARWTSAGLEVRQLWIRALAAEPLMLERFAQWLAEDAFQLVSYNGRCFDAPLLRARYRLCRQRDPLHGLPHHDLLHAVRRRFRLEWPSCRLAEAEARLLGVRRVDDLPGAQVPAAFLAALRSGSTTPLQRVRAHHRQDLLSLAGLLPRLCELAFEAPRSWMLQASRAGGRG